MNSSSFYNEEFKFRISSHSERDFSKVALILPGQGSLDLQRANSEVRNLSYCQSYFQKADEWALRENLPKISSVAHSKGLNNRDEFLLKNLYLFVLTVGLYEEAKASGRTIEMLTSHSFGECALLVCSGLISFEDGLNIVKWREDATPEAGTVGTLVAISGELSQVQDLLDGESVFLANVNSSKQTVLAVRNAELPALKSNLKKKKIAAIELKTVARPYHCKLMSDAAETLKNRINASGLVLQPVAVSFVSSVNQKIYTRGTVVGLDEVAEIMSQQLTSPVLFPAQIKQIFNLGIGSFLELGFSEFYLGFVTEVLEGEEIYAHSMSMFTRKSEDRQGNKNWSVDVENSAFLTTLRKYINKVTGYDVLDIQVHDQFQEDLRIDSIKKAEIVFKTLEELNLSIDESMRLAQLRSVGDIVDFLEALKKNPVKSSKSRKLEFAVYAKTPGVLPLIDHFSQPLVRVIEIGIGEPQWAQKIPQALQGHGSETVLLKVEKNFNNNADRLQFMRDVRDAFVGVELLSPQALIILQADVEFEEAFNEIRAFLKSFAKELKFKFRSCIGTGKFNFANFAAQLQVNPFAVDYLYENDLWKIEALSKLESVNTSSDSKSPSLESLLKNPQAGIVVIGGHRGLGFELLKRKVFPKECSITLVGRSGLENPEITKALKVLGKKYSQVTFRSGDARNTEFMSSLLTEVRPSLVVNSAGVEFSRLLQEKTDLEIETEYLTKKEIMDNLLSLEKTLNFRTINFSSVAAQFGNPGQTVYSMTSSFQALHPQHLNIFWPPLEKVGMTENLGILMKLKESGLGILPIEEGAKLFRDLLSTVSAGQFTFMTSHDRFLYDVELSIDINLFRSLGYLVDPKNSVFMKIFNREADRFVLDHVIENMPVIPASYQLASLMVMASGYYKNFADMNNFNIKNIMLMVEGEDLKAFTHIDDGKDGKLKGTVFTQMEHFSAEFSESHRKFETARSLADFDLKVNCSEFYSPECVGFGPKMQVLRDTYYNSETKEIISLTQPVDFHFSGNRIVDLWMAAFEMGFQTMALKGILGGKGLCIPLSIEEIQIYSHPWGSLKIKVDLHDIFKDNDSLPMKGTIIGYTADDKVSFVMRDVLMSKIRHFDQIPFHTSPEAKRI